LIDLSSPQRYTYANCISDLQHIKITGGGHQWPGIATLVGGAGTINMDFYSPQVIWDFLSGKACPSNGLSHQTGTNSISVFPNPTTNEVYIEKSGAWQFEITDQFGKVQLSGNEQTEIRMSALDAGIYWIHVSDDGGSSMYRIVKINE
jgi:hypothetical protein